jgi:type II secretory ATPase GspE/PulE/Tfp pilus assembly ATPase PilB-like protein
MGVEPFLVSSSLIAILAQRLVRVICPKCKEKYTPEPAVLKDLGLKEGTQLYKGKGCDACKNSGYAGRLGIYELLHVSDEIKKSVVARAAANEIKKIALKEGMRTLRDDGMDKLKRGITTVEELLRVTAEEG